MLDRHTLAFCLLSAYDVTFMLFDTVSQQVPVTQEIYIVTWHPAPEIVKKPAAPKEI